MIPIKSIYLSISIPIILLNIYWVFLPQKGYCENFDRSWLIAKFTELDLALNNGEGFSKDTNEEGKLAWAESHLLEAYIEMYQATGNFLWLDKFLNHAKRVLNSNDYARGIKDYKGRSLYGWSAQRPVHPIGWKPGNKIDLTLVNKPRVVFWVHSGMICYPLIKFSLLAKYDNLPNKYSRESDKIVSFVEKAMQEFNYKWRYNDNLQEGYYVFDNEPVYGNPTSGLPENKITKEYRSSINSDLALGKVFIILYQVTNNTEYYLKAKALANKFKKQLVVKGNYYIWKYRYAEDQGLSKVYEDISHGGTDITFAYDAYNADIVFNIDDIKLFSHTYINMYKNGRFSTYVSGEGDKPDYSLTSARWLDLSTVNPEVFNIGFNYLTNHIKNINRDHPVALLGISKLLKYGNNLKQSAN
ncbi:hypothetical protein [Desulfobacca acetoxidans]|uniref:D-glucuronyl C5-epimerase C-terminal domain-containing protein n=1 Tax=Desulfobacca acetoxidans (strain ATCC 700848 / DSM 11109 / ASRB2) TaxID=880072 RepID=F2NIK3_DESAR|nr:hypothetical protein [Desulfobacca acetoxidans]AEB10478.1 hypothetical protein Desac_2663 [Desulfobacca acetoxidans DSM 11109]